MKIGVVVPQGWFMEYRGWDEVAAWNQTVAVAQQADRMGFDSVWLYDHFHTVPQPADEIVFEPGASDDPGGESEVSEEEGAPLSDDQLQALWLRRVQTKPADFLRAKFAYQLAMGSEP